MTGVIMAVCLVAACMSIAFGVVKFVFWLITWQDRDLIRATEQGLIVAQARAEFPPVHTQLRELEIRATQRGDLHAAAVYAQAQDELIDQFNRDYAIAMLDQEQMGEAW